MEVSGAKSKTEFILAAIFNRPVRVTTTNMYHHEYTAELTTLQRQYRAIGNNYNQIVKHLKTTFGEKKALELLYRLEQETIGLVKVNREIIALTQKLVEEDVHEWELKLK